MEPTLDSKPSGRSWHGGKGGAWASSLIAGGRQVAQSRYHWWGSICRGGSTCFGVAGSRVSRCDVYWTRSGGRHAPARAPHPALVRFSAGGSEPITEVRKQLVGVLLGSALARRRERHEPGPGETHVQAESHPPADLRRRKDRDRFIPLAQIDGHAPPVRGGNPNGHGRQSTDPARTEVVGGSGPGARAQRSQADERYRSGVRGGAPDRPTVTGARVEFHPHVLARPQGSPDPGSPAERSVERALGAHHIFEQPDIPALVHAPFDGQAGGDLDTQLPERGGGREGGFAPYALPGAIVVHFLREIP